MASKVEVGHKTFTVGETIGKHLMVRIASGVLEVAQGGEVAIGTADEAALTATQVISVHLFSTNGTMFAVADGAITAGVIVYGANSGLVSATNTGSDHAVGVAMQTVTTLNDIIEILPSTVGAV